MSNFNIRLAQKSDAQTILNYIKKIAEYEKMSDCVVNTKELIEQVVFDDGKAKVFIGEEDGKPVGFALFFETYSTFVGKTGIHLEDLFVDEEKRGSGYGKKLFKAVIEYAYSHGCERVDWVCLDWNTPSQKFYDYMGASYLSEWRLYRLAGGSIKDALDK